MTGSIDREILARIGAVIGANNSVKFHDMDEELSSDRPHIKVKISIYSSFVEHPADLISLMRKVRSMVPRQYSIHWTIKTVA